MIQKIGKKQRKNEILIVKRIIEGQKPNSDEKIHSFLIEWALQMMNSINIDHLSSSSISQSSICSI